MEPNGTPFRKLHVFAQSLLETLSWAGIIDLIDGMKLTEEWGATQLGLDKTSDVARALDKNEKIRASVPLTMGSCFLEVDEGPVNLKHIWNNEVRAKEMRIGEETPKEVFVTMFCTKDDEGPRLRNRLFC
ncbi:uncharacterized protein L3040_001782 [Drepanopeziza brunnea f. sp. 'multigermtubi']|uniref:Uncharacterized protein n=1 Tax=Marssonina brunnea f. sp. multigermtubi (strain MB_m1) TaxID=1072389 RepID=K1XS65_MARBU|nr:uncharacterized protein MBM_06630 [Drepanopeziza brunnea f. sp. 'multigermtubi' MB_m1]EKD15414.1 hypothetical protein MBM_06630 [Drepanopeziza brunnea f. sp. 'multigermtubi' MB_m1]KAJ5052022.1 hypothetical protein L3040_001782 [Drepanopeziza brunnea f. sp. 'multigermtubi']